MIATALLAALAVLAIVAYVVVAFLLLFLGAARSGSQRVSLFTIPIFWVGLGMIVVGLFAAVFFGVLAAGPQS